MGNLPPFPYLSDGAITIMVQAGSGLSIVGLSVSLLALGYDHVMCVWSPACLPAYSAGAGWEWCSRQNHSLASYHTHTHTHTPDTQRQGARPLPRAHDHHPLHLRPAGRHPDVHEPVRTYLRMCLHA